MPQASTAELFEKAVAEHSRRLLAIARGIVGNRGSSEDIVQQALLNLFQHRDRYDWNEPGGLMRRAVVNEALRLLRQPRMAAVSDDLPLPDRRGGAAEAGAGGAEGLIERETVIRVRLAIDRLPDHFRAALVLCEYEQMAYAEIAEVLGITIPEVKTWLHRARRKLAILLADLNDDTAADDDDIDAPEAKMDA